MKGARSCLRQGLLIGLVLGAFIAAHGQSGRRLPREPKAPPAPAAAPPKVEPAETTPAVAKLGLLVTSRVERGIVSADRARAIMYSFAERLKAERGIAVKDGSASGYEGARSIAEAGKEGYVVWLNLIPDMYDSGSPYAGAINYDDIIVQYTVFAPGTGQKKAEGRVYYQSYQQRSRTLGRPNVGGQPLPPTRIPVEYTPERAGRETAERVLKSIKNLIPAEKSMKDALTTTGKNDALL
jgi:pyruvate/2-oxoglutarate dehydrogenase complex dihydrolipoamide acyltransferase (E2) component